MPLLARALMALSVIFAAFALLAYLGVLVTSWAPLAIAALICLVVGVTLERA
jgi:hypothetical protein